MTNARKELIELLKCKAKVKCATIRNGDEWDGDKKDIILKVGYSKIFGTDSGLGIFITTFLGMIVFITALLIWKTWAGRSPD